MELISIKRQVLISILLLITTLAFCQSENNKNDSTKFLADTIDGIYIPKNLIDCLNQIDGFFNDSTKTEIKKLSEDDFTANAHFGFGLWMRNNWRLWGASRLSKHFNDLGIFHPDDMSGIILDSYHRYLNDREIKLDTQIEHYKLYWKVNEDPKNEDYPNGETELEFNSKTHYNLEANGYPATLHIQTNAKGGKVWIYDYHFGWLHLTDKQLKKLNEANGIEKELKKLFSEDKR